MRPMMDGDRINRWQKLGLVFDPQDHPQAWYKHSFMTPTPFMLNPDTIRVFGGFRDDEGVSRIGFVDVAANDPSRILGYSKKPVLDIGKPGMFDDNGVILGDVVRTPDGTVRMYYVGFQLVQKVKFLAYTGLAISHDDGHTFARFQDTPVLDRHPSALYFNAIHTAIQEDGKWRFWCGAGSDWAIINGIPYPRYSTWYAESEDGIHDIQLKKVCLDPQDGEYRLGRPRVYKPYQNGYEMLFTFDTYNKEYMAASARSTDGVNWEREGKGLALSPGPETWDAEMACYMAPISTLFGTYAFYSGNGMGKTGLGVAKQV